MQSLKSSQKKEERKKKKEETDDRKKKVKAQDTSLPCNQVGETMSTT